MTNRSKSSICFAVAFGAFFAVAGSAHAQVATTLEQAELAGLSPQKKAEVQTRMGQGGQKVGEILQTILLNNVKLKMPASRIVAMDFNRGIAVVEVSRGRMRVVHFDTSTLALKS